MNIFTNIRDKITQQYTDKNFYRLRAELQATNDPKVFLSLLRHMSAHSPREAIKMIESGWESGKIPVGEAILKEYLKAVAAVGQVDSLNISALTALVAQDGTTSVEGIDNLKKQLSMIQAANSSGGGDEGGGYGYGGNGATPDRPLYVAEAPPSMGRSLLKTIGKLGAMFIVLAFAMSIIEEKSGGAMKGGFMNGSVQQAENSDKNFDDVVGVDEAKAELKEIVMYLKDPSKFTRLGGKLPRGVLLTGPPGTGKTLLAKAVAGEAQVPFLFSSGAEFEEMFVGVGARRVRDLFNAARQKAPCIIFIDEIDAVGGKRNDKNVNQTARATLNQLLVEMDGFKENSGVIVIAATNLSDRLDTALTRPGRFDKHVNVPLPDIGGRRQIMELYGRQMKMDPTIDYEQLARGTAGFSGADLFNLMNQGAIYASVQGLKAVGMDALEWAKDKVMMGSERKTAIISLETMSLTAFHEAGHALVALKTPGSSPIHKATIMPRGQALGMVMQLTEGDGTSWSKKQMLARLDVCMGGRVAEELVFGEDEVTSGASSDIQQATKLAKAMVMRFGLNEKVGVMLIEEGQQISEETQGWIDAEVRKLLTESYFRAKVILTSHRKELDLLAHGLLDYESLSGDEIVLLLNGTKPDMKNRSQKPSRPLKEITKALPPSGGGRVPVAPKFGLINSQPSNTPPKTQ